MEALIVAPNQCSLQTTQMTRLDHSTDSTLKKIITIEGTTEALLLSAMNLSRRRSSLLWANKLSISMGWTSTLVDMQDFACNVEDKEKRLVMISWDPLDLSKMSVGGRKEVCCPIPIQKREQKLGREFGGWDTNIDALGDEFEDLLSDSCARVSA